jgi:transcriptional pleiotropic regulator of transition state genes
MKATGIVRRIDDLGRVVIPKELRRTLNIADGDPIEIFVDSERIILKKYAPGCKLCGSVENLTAVVEHLLCKTCINKIADAK